MFALLRSSSLSLFSLFVNREWSIVNKSSNFDHSPLTIDYYSKYLAEHQICAIITQKIQFSVTARSSDANLCANLWIQSFGNEREFSSATKLKCFSPKDMISIVHG